ncbi:MAG: hypothetical protein E7211_16940 [Clostridium lundense]|nr:hypothetical protein [Clostridium lundense]
MIFSKFSTNDHIYIYKEGITGILLHECKEPLNTWSVLIKKNDTILIRRVHIDQIRPYENRCWYCGTVLNGVKDYTCSQCHWTKCPNCGKCRKPNCEPDGILIEAEYNSLSGWNPLNNEFNTPLSGWNPPNNEFNTSLSGWNPPNNEFNTHLSGWNPPNNEFNSTLNKYNINPVADDDDETNRGF